MLKLNNYKRKQLWFLMRCLYIGDAPHHVQRQALVLQQGAAGHVVPVGLAAGRLAPTGFPKNHRFG